MKRFVASIVTAGLTLSATAQTAELSAEPSASPTGASTPTPTTTPATADPASAPAVASPHTFTANIALVSDYRFRGIDQTYNRPALQGGIDYSHSSGIYLGNWNSNVNSGAGFPSGNLEMDFYGGWKTTRDDWGLDLGAIYYYYPGSDARSDNGTTILNNRSGNGHNGHIDNKEIYVAASWKFLTLKYSYALDDYFSIPDTQGSGYVELNASHPLGDGWGVNAHVGYLHLKNYDNGNYTDWKVGVSKDLSGWLLALSYVGTNAKGNCGNGEPYCFGNDSPGATKTRDAGRDVVIFSISRSF